MNPSQQCLPQMGMCSLPKKFLILFLMENTPLEITPVLSSFVIEDKSVSLLSCLFYLDLALTKTLHSVTSSLYIVNSTLWGLRESPSLQIGGAQTAERKQER